MEKYGLVSRIVAMGRLSTMEQIRVIQNISEKEIFILDEDDGLGNKDLNVRLELSTKPS